MLPILFNLGSVKIYTLSFILSLGFLLYAFLTWRRLFELGFKEEKIIDFILASGFSALFFSRLFYLGLHFQEIGFQVSVWFDWRHLPGFSFWGGLLGFILVLALFCRKEKWSFWLTHDELIFSLLPFLVLIQLGSFLEGLSPGKVTSLPWGIYFPGQLLRRQPVAVFLATGLLLIWLILLKIERQWRTWSWYPSQAAGFLSLLFWTGLFLLNGGLAFWRENRLYLYWLEIGLSFVGAVLSLLIFYWRSGRRRQQNDEKKQAKN